MTPTDMLRVVISDMERVITLMESGPPGYVLHTADYVRFMMHDDSAVARLDEPTLGDLCVLRTPRAARAMQDYWNGMQTEEWKKVMISLRRDALKRHLEGHIMLIEALYEYSNQHTKGALQ